MKRSFRFIAVASFAVSLAACVTPMPQPQVTPVIATDADQHWFAGVWRGRVDSSDSRFAGSVEFRFEREGAVILPSHPAPSRILWVRLTGSHVSGALEPYFDPQRGSDVYTIFDATLSDGILSGSLHERTHMQWQEAATWAVVRVAN